MTSLVSSSYDFSTVTEAGPRVSPWIIRSHSTGVRQQFSHLNVDKTLDRNHILIICVLYRISIQPIVLVYDCYVTYIEEPYTTQERSTKLNLENGLPRKTTVGENGFPRKTTGLE